MSVNLISRNGTLFAIIDGKEIQCKDQEQAKECLMTHPFVSSKGQIADGVIYSVPGYTVRVETDTTEEKQMKVHPESIRFLGQSCPKTVPWGFLNEEYANNNHGQTLTRLNERGGLGVGEMLSILRHQRWGLYGDSSSTLSELILELKKYRESRQVAVLSLEAPEKEGEQPAQPVDKDEAEIYLLDMLERWKKYINDGKLDLSNNLRAQVNKYADLKYRPIIDRKHAVNVDLKIQIEALKSVSPSPERGESDGWISVNDRLPEIGNEVIVYSPESISRNGVVTALCRKIRYEGATKFYWDNYYGGSNIYIQQAISHWMPLPKPPKQ